MGQQTVLIVPATVPDALVTRVSRRQEDRPTVVSADPVPVPVARPIRLFPQRFTAELVAQLWGENRALRQELARVAAG